MEDIYLFLVIILMATAVVDLVVGVGNDAVNFLNSAIGSRVAPFRTILIIASLGVVIGCTFSSGMMEVARNGLFNPGFFPFDKIMIVFMAVMLTDVILLDIYNSFGLPTSTTVSLVFEILGAAFATGFLFQYQAQGSFPALGDVINQDSALNIIFSIFLSVFLSFLLASAVQYVTRIAFTFELEKSIRKYGAIFSGTTITTITYFLLIKGAKGSVFITDEMNAWISGHTVDILIVSAVFWSIVVQLLMWWKNINPLKPVVLLGTFALAMAFAANDLVNFVGVPVAGFLSYENWAASGLGPGEMKMGILASKIATPYWILLVSGVVMVLTLWTNAKARKVTETEVSLGRQDEGDEKFQANFLSRAMVGAGVGFGKWLDNFVPKSISKAVSIRLSLKEGGKKKKESAPSFDLLRASVNLLVSSSLIAYGTANKLPLSTTFVTFMVAMGSSFADQAWGRESAVYRVAGVINVIASWFLTAAVAFGGAGLIAVILTYTGTTGFFVMAGAATFFLIRSHVIFQRRARIAQAESKAFASDAVDSKHVLEQSRENTVKTLKAVRKVIQHSVSALENEKQGPIVKAKEEIVKLQEQNEKLHGKIIKQVRKMEHGQLLAGRLYILVFDHIQDLYQSATLISEVSSNHVINHHPRPNTHFLNNLKDIEKLASDYLDASVKHIDKGDFASLRSLHDHYVKIDTLIRKFFDREIGDIQMGLLSSRMGLLQTQLFLELQDVVEVVDRVNSLYVDYHYPPFANP
jgi:phosphate/sulfate permease